MADWRQKLDLVEAQVRQHEPSVNVVKGPAFTIFDAGTRTITVETTGVKFYVYVNGKLSEPGIGDAFDTAHAVVTAIRGARQ